MSKNSKHNLQKESGQFKPKTTPFTMIPNEVLKDKRLSLGAKGLYALIQHFITIPKFTLHKSHLRTFCKEGDYAFDTCWNNLVQIGYLTIEKTNTHSGFVYEYDLKDSLCDISPDPNFPSLGNPDVGNPAPGNWGANNTNRIRIINNTHSIIDDDYALALDRIRALLDPYIQLEKQKAFELGTSIQEIEQSCEVFFKALHAIKDPKTIKAINSADLDSLYGFWRRIFFELFDTSIYDGPERSVGNKIGYVIEMIKNEFH